MVREEVIICNWMVMGMLYVQLRALLLPRGEVEELMDARTYSDLLSEAVEWVAVHDTLPTDETARDYTITAVRRKYNALIKGARIRQRIYANDLPTKETKAREG